MCLSPYAGLRPHCDLIVMGFHGHGRLHHALIGSVSDSVMRASTLPVLLMRGGQSPVAAAIDV